MPRQSAYRPSRGTKSRGPTVTAEMRDLATAPRVRYVRPNRSLKKSGVLGVGPPPAITPEVQAVLDRMSGLLEPEFRAMQRYVDGMVADGIYGNINEIYAPCFNATDFLTGFKFMTLIESEVVPLHLDGQGVEYNSNAMYHLDPQTFDFFGAPEGFIGVYNVFTGADVAGNSDLFGCVQGGVAEILCRWRGDDDNDFNEQYNVDSLTPRTTASVRPTGDIVGIGYNSGNIQNLQPGGSLLTAVRTSLATEPKIAMQWHGENQDGVPAAGNMQNQRTSLMFHSDGLSNAQVLTMRSRSLQFLRDIGVTGIPAT